MVTCMQKDILLYTLILIERKKERTIIERAFYMQDPKMQFLRKAQNNNVSLAVAIVNSNSTFEE